MKILSIETSCDDTAISILECGGSRTSPVFRVLANEKISQEKKHAEYGGVYPNLAKNEHTKNLPILYEKVLSQAKLNATELELISVTSGPGLEPALWTGITFAQERAKELDIPLMPINHMEGHVWSFFGRDEGKFKMPQIEHPMLALLVSGGHTQLVLVEKFGKYKIIGETLDDAVGEAFDKVARMLDLPYPGGPHISRLAEENRNSDLRGLAQGDPARAGAKIQQNFMRSSKDTIPEFNFPRPMMHTKDYNFSYSGLKTSVLYTIEKLKVQYNGILQNNIITQIALEFENAAIEPIVHKTKRAVEEFGIQTLVVGGGVAANKHLRAELEKNINIPTHFPAIPALSADNSLMIGIVAWLTYLERDVKIPKNPKIKANGKLKLA